MLLLVIACTVALAAPPPVLVTIDSAKALATTKPTLFGVTIDTYSLAKVTLTPNPNP